MSASRSASRSAAAIVPAVAEIPALPSPGTLNTRLPLAAVLYFKNGVHKELYRFLNIRRVEVQYGGRGEVDATKGFAGFKGYALVKNPTIAAYFSIVGDYAIASPEFVKANLSIVKGSPTTIAALQQSAECFRTYVKANNLSFNVDEILAVR